MLCIKHNFDWRKKISADTYVNKYFNLSDDPPCIQTNTTKQLSLDSLNDWRCKYNIVKFISCNDIKQFFLVEFDSTDNMYIGTNQFAMKC